MGGAGAGNAEKDTLPQAVKWGGAGKRAGARVFRGPVRPVTISNINYYVNIFLLGLQRFIRSYPSKQWKLLLVPSNFIQLWKFPFNFP